MRVTCAQFARMVGVSKQAISEWKKRGIIELGPDGKLDPAKATRQVIERTNPVKLRARVFKQATATLDELRTRVRQLEAELAAEREWSNARACAAAARAEDHAARQLCRFTDALVARWDEARNLHGACALSEWLDELAAIEFYGVGLADYRAGLAADADGL